MKQLHTWEQGWKCKHMSVLNHTNGCDKNTKKWSSMGSVCRHDAGEGLGFHVHTFNQTQTGPGTLHMLHSVHAGLWHRGQISYMWSLIQVSVSSAWLEIPMSLDRGTKLPVFVPTGQLRPRTEWLKPSKLFVKLAEQSGMCFHQWNIFLPLFAYREKNSSPVKSLNPGIPLAPLHCACKRTNVRQ